MSARTALAFLKCPCGEPGDMHCWACPKCKRPYAWEISRFENPSRRGPPDRWEHHTNADLWASLQGTGLEYLLPFMVGLFGFLLGLGMFL